MNDYILAGDVGGTKTLLALAVMEERGALFLHKKRYGSREAASLDELIDSFLSEVSIDRSETVLSLGVAGPVMENKSITTNLPWTVDGPALKKKMGFKEVGIMNDFMAIACAIPSFSAADLETLNSGRKEEKGPIAVIGAGTGLGEGMAFWCTADERYKVIASEGGHADFAPKNGEEMGLLRWLMKKEAHVSYEKLLSGPGLVNIYQYLVNRGFSPLNKETEKTMRGGDGAAVIAARGLAGEDKNCVHAIELFASIYGAEAGNLALKVLPTGGLYIAGGIAPKLMEKLKGGGFMEAFLGKGRLSAFLKNIPVYIIGNTEAGLLGALGRAGEIMDETS